MFVSASASGDDWRHAIDTALDRLPPASAAANLGFIYVTEVLASNFTEVVERARAETGIADWVGAVGLGVCGTGAEYFDEAAVALMVIETPPGGHRLFERAGDAGTPGPASAPTQLGSLPLVVLHADSNNQNLFEDMETVSQVTGGYLVGGLTASARPDHQVAGGFTGGGVSGVVLAPEVRLVTALSQGCAPIGDVHRIDMAEENIVIEIDGRPALDVLRVDVGEVLARDLRRAAGYIHAALPVAGSDTGDYVVRNLIGFDEERGLIAIAAPVSPGDAIMFVSRDAGAARADLGAMLEKLKSRAGAMAEGGIKGAHYISCIARGPNMFGGKNAELELVRGTLGDVPLVGMYANGEISNDRLYSYTGVLTLFV
ncbi:MAG: FIST C-terminal domain-containing protein [Rhodospirillales bacterium]|jgi:small ligand-binding sensory domain FIST|nr:FIST C-terminal domain-containing protein [Rhodospirillales bacterium]